MRVGKDTLMVAGAVVLCPCHWPLLALLVSGTAAGAFLAANALWLGAVALIGVLAVFGGTWWLGTRRAAPTACAVPTPAVSQRSPMACADSLPAVSDRSPVRELETVAR